MNKTELVETVATQVGLSKRAAKAAVDTIFVTIEKTMCDGEPVRITGFGTFGPKARKGGTRYNPQTRRPITISSYVAPGFRASDQIKGTIKKKLKVVESGGELSIVKAVR